MIYEHQGIFIYKHRCRETPKYRRSDRLLGATLPASGVKARRREAQRSVSSTCFGETKGFLNRF